MTLTPDQEAELQKAAEEYARTQCSHSVDSLRYSTKGKQMLIAIDFIAGAKHQDAISRRDEREKIVEYLKSYFSRFPSYVPEEHIREVLRQLETGETK